MTRKHVGRNVGNSGRINVSSSELGKIGLGAGDAVDVEVADTTAVTHDSIDPEESDEYLLVIPA